jgi:hypothetical protein
MQTLTIVQRSLFFAGLAQIALVIGSWAIPTVLQWKIELAKVGLLTRQMFWTYAAYIFVINLCFGLISAFDYRDLTDGSRLTTLLTGFIAVYWISRILIQFFYFDRTGFPKGKWHLFAEIVLVIVYSWAFYFNYCKM